MPMSKNKNVKLMIILIAAAVIAGTALAGCTGSHNVVTDPASANYTAAMDSFNEQSAAYTNMHGEIANFNWSDATESQQWLDNAINVSNDTISASDSLLAASEAYKSTLASTSENYSVVSDSEVAAGNLKDNATRFRDDCSYLKKVYVDYNDLSSRIDALMVRFSNTPTDPAQFNDWFHGTKDGIDSFNQTYNGYRGDLYDCGDRLAPGNDLYMAYISQKVGWNAAYDYMNYLKGQYNSYVDQYNSKFGYKYGYAWSI
jgi:hypothetical protein